MAALVVMIITKQKITDYYWLNILDEKSPFVACIEQNNLVGNNLYNGKNIIYLGSYLAHTNKILGKNTDQISKEFVGYLKKIFPHFLKLLDV